MTCPANRSRSGNSATSPGPSVATSPCWPSISAHSTRSSTTPARNSSSPAASPASRGHTPTTSASAAPRHKPSARANRPAAVATSPARAACRPRAASNWNNPASTSSSVSISRYPPPDRTTRDLAPGSAAASSRRSAYTCVCRFCSRSRDHSSPHSPSTSASSGTARPAITASIATNLRSIGWATPTRPPPAETTSTGPSSPTTSPRPATATPPGLASMIGMVTSREPTRNNHQRCNPHTRAARQTRSPAFRGLVLRRDDHLGQDVPARLAVVGLERALELHEMGRCQLQGCLVRLIGPPDRIVHARRSAHLDVAAKQVAHRPPCAPVGEPVDRTCEGRPVADVQASRVDGVAGEQEPGVTVVVGDRRLVVPRCGEAVDNAAAEVDLGHGLGLPGESEVRPRRLTCRADDDGVGPPGELAVSRDVVTVRVCVQDQQPVVIRMRMTGQPAADDRIDGAPQREELRARGSTGVEKEGSGAAKEQEHERRLVVDRLVLAQDIGVLVAGVDLDVGIGVVLGGLGSVNPRDVQVRNASTIGEADLSYCHEGTLGILVVAADPGLERVALVTSLRHRSRI